MRKEFEEQQRQGPLAAITGFAPGGALRGGGNDENGGSGGSSISRTAQNFDMAAWMAGHNTNKATTSGGDRDGAGVGDSGAPSGGSKGSGGGGSGGSATGSSGGGGKARRRG